MALLPLLRKVFGYWSQHCVGHRVDEDFEHFLAHELDQAALSTFRSSRCRNVTPNSEALGPADTPHARRLKTATEIKRKVPRGNAFFIYSEYKLAYGVSQIWNFQEHRIFALRSPRTGGSKGRGHATYVEDKSHDVV
ncbi:MAG: hypothetical protein HY682_04355 [Chloroflexi bacterium]|nr:hypothetical protein [Chloroflexota bacterium]